MPDRPSFPIPDDLTPDTYCLQIVMPNDPIWKAVIAGLLFQPAEWFNWQRDENRSGKILAQYWREIYANIDWSDMSCCCPDSPPVQYKYIGTVLYRSTDGGETFVPAPEYDYRNTSVQWPKPSEIGVPSTKCQAADSVVYTFRNQINQQITEDMGAAAILGVIAAALLIFLTAGTSASISAQVVAVVAAALGAGVTAWQAAFTTTVWDNFRCLIYQNMVDDESIDQEGLDNLYNQLDSTFSGIVVPTLKGYIAASGLVGINNMMASNSGDPDASCCTECSMDIWAITIFGGYPIGTLLAVGANYIDVQLDPPVPGFGGGYFAQVTTPDSLTCCTLVSVEVLTGAAVIATGILCGEPLWPSTEVHSISLPASVNTIRLVEPSSTTSTVRLTFS